MSAFAPIASAPPPAPDVGGTPGERLSLTLSRHGEGHSQSVRPQPAVADGIARDVVTAAANGDQEIIGSSEIHRMDNVGDTANSH